MRSDAPRARGNAAHYALLCEDLTWSQRQQNDACTMGARPFDILTWRRRWRRLNRNSFINMVCQLSSMALLYSDTPDYMASFSWSVSRRWLRLEQSHTIIPHSHYHTTWYIRMMVVGQRVGFTRNTACDVVVTVMYLWMERNCGMPKTHSVPCVLRRLNQHLSGRSGSCRCECEKPHRVYDLWIRTLQQSQR